MKTSIVGLGHVGATIAYTLVIRGLTDKLVLVNRNQNKAKGDALDLLHSLAFTDHTIPIIPGTLEQTERSDVIILCLSAPWQENYTSRLDIAPDNLQLFKEWVPSLAKKSPNARLIVVTNPVDVMTYFTIQLSGFSSNQVLGVGTLIDSARFRKNLSEQIGIHADDIRAYILGEHGETQFPVLSNAAAGGVKLGDEAESAMVFKKSAYSGWEIVRGKGYSNFAISMATALIVESIYLDNLRTMPISTLISGYQNVHDVCLSVPAVVGAGGIVRILEPALNTDEAEAFRQSARVVQEAIESLKKIL